MIVADTNLIAYLMLAGDQTPGAQAVFRHDPEWTAPLVWRSEFRNVLALYLRQGHLTLTDAQQYMEEAETLMQAGEYQVVSAPVLALAEATGLSAYDSEFVHLAKELVVPLVTADKAVLKACPEIAVSMKKFVF